MSTPTPATAARVPEPACVELRLPHHVYRVLIAPGLLGQLGRLVDEVAPHARCGLIADAHVEPHFGPIAADSLQSVGYQPARVSLTPGETHKTLATVADVYERLLDARLERRSPLIALGGGVTGDTVGFVAATYLRGVPFVQCPTTLLAMVDASVGGKTGVNLARGKNLVGAFYQPHLVAIDTDTLNTLPTRQFRAGLAECVKHGVIRDPELFAWIEQQAAAIGALDPGVLVELVRRNVAIKAAVVMADEKEAGVRAHLNFGHTFAHAIEATTDYGRYEHGEAVGLGMIAAARLAADRGLCEPSVAGRIQELLQTLGLPVVAEDLPETEALMAAMTLDKKVVGGRIRLVLPTRLGEVVVVDDTPAEAVAAAWATLRS